MTKYYLIRRLSNNFIARMINEFTILFTDFDIYNANRNVITSYGDYKKITNELMKGNKI